MCILIEITLVIVLFQILPLREWAGLQDKSMRHDACILYGHMSLVLCIYLLTKTQFAGIVSVCECEVTRYHHRLTCLRTGFTRYLRWALVLDPLLVDRLKHEIQLKFVFSFNGAGDDLYQKILQSLRS